MRITVGIPTKGRYDSLVLTLLGLAFQTTKDFDVIIVDDNENPTDLRTFPAYQSVFHLFNEYKIGWQVLFGRKLGQHHCHQMVQEMAKTDWIWRIDDDEIPEPNLLARLLSHAVKAVGAVGSLVLPPSPLPVPDQAANVISDLNRPNVQWFRHTTDKLIECEHLHSTFLYRRGIAGYELALSPAAHREETLFTHELYRKGYKLLVDPQVVTWHFRSQTGGIRSHQNPEFWENDEKLFHEKLQEWGVNAERSKTIVLDCGKGDHVVVKKLLPELKAKYGKIIAATCFPDVFDGEVEQISIAEAHQRLGNLDRFNIYRSMIDWNWRDNLEAAYRKLYGLDDTLRAIRPPASERSQVSEKLSVAA